MSDFLRSTFAAALVSLLASCLVGCVEEATPLPSSSEKPEDNRFTKVVLAEQLDEPMQFEILPDERVVFVERKGKVKVYDPAMDAVSVIADIPVSVGYYAPDGTEIEPTGEDGMQGLALDPDFSDNGYVYLYYSPQGGAHRSELARYTWTGSQLDLASRKLLLTVDNQRESCCHLGGGMLFDPAGNLYLTTGDNTPNDPLGYSPLDERPGYDRFDSQRSSANTNSLRGKILRIHPKDDGTYTIPEGNLFPVGTPSTRPEIYTMGNRNPWRLSQDSKTGWLYWGEVGPGGVVDSVGMGPRSYDEFNQARGPGNFGWPYVIANNKAYWDYDYATDISEAQYDPHALVNHSPNSDGITELPPAVPALIWYPQSQAVDFPQLGSGSNSAVGGPVYRAADFTAAQRPFPAYYEGKWFVTDWTRGWIKVVSLDDHGDFTSMEDFFPGAGLVGPIDMAFGPNGDLYVLEYGRGLYRRNQVAQLVRIEYSAGNRAPLAVATASKTAGAVPFTVQLGSEGTLDYDGDPLHCAWIIEKEGKTVQTATGTAPKLLLDAPGTYRAILTVSDGQDHQSTATLLLYAGNEPPAVALDLQGANRSFFFPEEEVSLSVRVEDAEDGSTTARSVSPDDVAIQVDYLANDYYLSDIGPELTGAAATIPARTVLSEYLIQQSDCLNCHHPTDRIVGPSYAEVRARYRSDPTAVDHLTKAILNGGSGHWDTEMAMPAHPTLTEDDTRTIVKYILDQRDALATDLPRTGEGTVRLSRPATEKTGEEKWYNPEIRLRDKYLIRASYTDRGTTDAPPQSTTALVVLRNPTIPVAFFDAYEGVRITHDIFPERSHVVPKPGGALILQSVDLADIASVELVATEAMTPASAAAWSVTLHLDAPKGPEVGTSALVHPGELVSLHIPLVATSGLHDLYFVFTRRGEVNDEELQIREVRFVPYQNRPELPSR